MMPSVKRRAVVAALVVGAALGAPGVAQAGWSAPSVLVDGDDAALRTAVVRPDGSLRAAISDAPRGIEVGLADRAPGGAAFTDPLVALRTPALVYQVALTPDGGGLALQTQRGGPDSVLAFDASGALQPPMTLGVVKNATVGVAPSGAAVAAWIAKVGQDVGVFAALRDAGSAAFGAPVRVGYTTSGDTQVSAGIGDRGEATVAWQVDAFPSAVAAAVRLPGAGFGQARFVSRGASDARLAVGPGGQAILAAGTGRTLQVSVKPAGAAAMPKARTLDRARQVYVGIAVAAAGARQVGIAWQVSGGGVRRPARARIYAGPASAARGPRRIGTLGRSVSGEFLGLALDPAGATLVAWEERLRAKGKDPTARSHLGLAFRPAGGRFGPTTFRGPVSLDDTPQATLLGPGGHGYVLYEAFQPGDSGGDSYRRVYVTERRP
jgi:hypothetical protein